MERIIKFRGKRTDNGEWVYGDLIHTTKDFKKRVQIIDWSTNEITVEVGTKTVGQFTGLKDKDGKKVYEGDILYDKYDDVLEDNGYGEIYCEVVFKNGAFGVMGKITDQFSPFSYNPITTEVVISNIYDNPELIKQLDNGR